MHFAENIPIFPALNFSSMKITKPNPDEYAPYYATYISKVDTDDPIEGLTELIHQGGKTARLHQFYRIC